MKTNIFKSSIMVLAMVASFSACTQDELGTEATTSEDALNVIAYSNDFVSSDAESRVTNTEYTTSFDEGDAIGIFVVRDGQVLVSNMKMILGSDGAWKGENNSPLYYYKDADYIAYYPYTEGLTATSESDIVKTFTEKLTADQGTAEAYRNADLMSVTVPAANVERGGDISFNMAHKMSMIELKIPVRRYTTADTDGYNYSVPTKIDLTINGNAFTPYTFADGVYRCIVAASSETPVTVKGCFYDGNTPVYFPKATAENADPSESVTPNEGTYKCLNIKYSGISENVVVRPIEVGDYVYADGNIYPYGDQSSNDLSTPPSAGCVGIVYSTTVPEDINSAGFNKAMVIALNDLNAKLDWSTVTNAVSMEKQYKTKQTNSTKPDDTEGDTDILTSLFADKNGYSNMNKVKTNGNFSSSTYPAFYNTLNSDNGLSDISKFENSGWYIPTIGQMADIINAFSALADAGYTFDASTAWSVNGNDDPTIASMLELYNRLTKVEGTWNIDTPNKNGETGKSIKWWTSSEYDESQAWSIDINCKKFVVLVRGKNSANSNNLYVRPVFAF